MSALRSTGQHARPARVVVAARWCLAHRKPAAVSLATALFVAWAAATGWLLTQPAQEVRWPAPPAAAPAEPDAASATRGPGGGVTITPPKRPLPGAPADRETRPTPTTSGQPAPPAPRPSPTVTTPAPPTVTPSPEPTKPRPGITIILPPWGHR